MLGDAGSGQLQGHAVAADDGLDDEWAAHSGGGHGHGVTAGGGVRLEDGRGRCRLGLLRRFLAGGEADAGIEAGGFSLAGAQPGSLLLAFGRVQGPVERRLPPCGPWPPRDAAGSRSG